MANLARTLRTLQEDFAVGCYELAGGGEARFGLRTLPVPARWCSGRKIGVCRALTVVSADGLLLAHGGEAESLNVSVAAGVALFEAVRQRQPA